MSRPLCRGRKVVLDHDREIWVSFKYEKLSNFCYWCGMVSHDDKECEVGLASKGSISSVNQEYGAWLRAFSYNSGKTHFTTVPGMGDGLGGAEAVGQTVVSLPTPITTTISIIDIESQPNLNSGDKMEAPHASHMETTESGEDNLLIFNANNVSNPEVFKSVLISSSFHTNSHDFEIQLQEIDTTLMKFDHKSPDLISETTGSSHLLVSHDYDLEIPGESYTKEAQVHNLHVAIPDQSSNSKAKSIRKWKILARDTQLMHDQNPLSTGTKRGREIEEVVQPELPTKKT